MKVPRVAVRDLRPLLSPASVAIVGASSRPESLAALPLKHLQRQGYKGPVYPINPQWPNIAGLPCYPSLGALPQTPELVLIVAPGPRVLAALEEAAGMGVRAAIVISAGFAEAGPEGIAQQRRMSELAATSGMIVCGPNSIGVLNYVDKIPLSFTFTEDMRRHDAGRVALVSQSGGLMVSLANRFFDEGVGISYAVATGNEADLTIVETLEYLAEDHHSDALVLIVEEIRDGPRFMAVCRRLLELGKPLVAHKIGRTQRGSDAARSHTGALAGSYRVAQAVFRQLGVLEATDLDGIVDLAAAAVTGRWPRGSAVGVITGSGGGGAAAADRAEELGLTLPSFGETSKERLAEFLPGFTAGTVENPFDATAQLIENHQAAGRIAGILAEDPAIDAVLVVDPGTGEQGRLRGLGLLEQTRASVKPVFEVVLSGSMAQPVYEALRTAGLPVFHSPGKAVEAIAALRGFAQARARPSSAAPSGLDGPLPANPSEYDAKRLLESLGVPVTADLIARSAAEAVAAAATLGFPVALKINSPDISHKTEIGGVRLNLASAAEVDVAYGEIVSRAAQLAPAAHLDGVLVSPMAEIAVELIAGFHTDPCFGPMVLLGLGGIWAEALDDVAMRPAPLVASDVVAMAGELRGAGLFSGARGLPPIPMEDVTRLLLTLSNLAISGLLDAVDINPLVMATDGHLIVLDASLYPSAIHRQ